MRLLTLIVPLLFLSLFAQGQGEANNWFFGNGAAVTFNNGPPVMLTGSSMNAFEGCSSISDGLGNLLFYSNGQSVWDANNNVMPNGTGLMGQASATQSGVVVPKPLSTNIYYVFTLPTGGSSIGLRYSEVDMSLNGGLGDVTVNKNVLVAPNMTEKLTAAVHANNTDIWVIAHHSGSNCFHSFLVTATGVQTTPVVSCAGLSNGYAVGYMKVSPDGTKLAANLYGWNQVEVFNFDDQTGVVSGPLVQIPSPNNADYGLEFSPDGTKLYNSGDGSNIIRQYDVSLGNPAAIIASQTIIGTAGVATVGALQLGPDEKIYCSRKNSNYLGVIDQPNLAGTACNYIDTAVFLGTGSCVYGLPNYIQSFFNVSIDYTGNCLGDTTFFSLLDTTGLDSIFWDFGDPVTGAQNTSTSFLPIHIFSDTGTFTVTAVGYADTLSDTSEVTITVITNPPIFSLGNDTTFCVPDTLQLIGGTNSAYDYVWQDSSTQQTFTVDSSGIFWVEVSNSCGAHIDSITVNITDPPQVDLGLDTGLCTQDSVTLQIGIPGVSYLWSTGATTNSITVGTTGTYWASTSDSTQCGTSDTILVEYYQVDSVDLGPDTLICQGDTLTLNSISGGTSYLWSNGFTTPSVDVYTGGTYWIAVEDSSQCPSSDTINLIVAPLPTVDLGPDTGICTGSSVLLQGTPNMSSYLWSSGHTFPDLFVTIAGTFWLQVTDSNGCSSTDTIITQVNPLPVFNLGNDTIICEGDSVTLAPALPGVNFSWSTGATTASITTGNAGTYWAEATDANGCMFSDTAQIQVMPLPIVNLGGDTLLCQGASYWVDVSNPGSQYTWSDAHIGPVRIMKDAGEFWVTVTSAFGCEVSDSLNVRTIDLEIGPDIQLCEGEQAILEVPDSLHSVTWFEHGSGNPLVAVDDGVYTVNATYEICVLEDSLEVSFFPFPPSPNFRDTILCFEDFPDGFWLKAGETVSTFQWSTGQQSPEIQVVGPGIYMVEITNSDQCSISDTVLVEDFCAPSIYFPNSFTPNSDGHNDVFKAYGSNVAEFELLIFNRWGEQVFSSNSIDQGWDGKVGGEMVQQDVYVWVAKYKLLNHRGATPDYEAQGRVTLLRQ